MSSLVRLGLVQRQRPAQHVQQLSARRHGQQRLRRKQPGIRQPDHRRSAGFGRAVQRGHQQRERRVRPLLRRHHQRRLGQRNESIPRDALRISAQHRSECHRLLQAAVVSNTGAVNALQETARSTATSSASTSAVRSSRTSCFSFSTTRASVRRCKPLYVLTLPTQNELQRHLVVPVKDPTRVRSIPPARRFLSCDQSPVAADLSHFKTF